MVRRAGRLDLGRIERARRLAFRDVCLALAGLVVVALLVSVLWPGAFMRLVPGAVVPLLILAATALGSLLWHGGVRVLASQLIQPGAALAGIATAAGGALIVVAPRLWAHQAVPIGMTVITAVCWGVFAVALVAVLPARRTSLALPSHGGKQDRG